MLNITDAVLSSALKELIADEIIRRQSYDEIPPRVEYSLTEKGQSVVPIFQSICRWSGMFYREEGDLPCRSAENVTIARENSGKR